MAALFQLSDQVAPPQGGDDEVRRCLQHVRGIFQGLHRRIVHPVKADDSAVIVQRNHHQRVDVLLLQVLVLERVAVPDVLQVIDDDMPADAEIPIPAGADFRRHVLEVLLLRTHPGSRPLVGIVVAALRVFLKYIGPPALQGLPQIGQQHLQRLVRGLLQQGHPEPFVDDGFQILDALHHALLLLMVAYVQSHFKTASSSSLGQERASEQEMPVQVPVVVLLFKAAFVRSASAAERTGGIAAPQDLIAWLSFDLLQGADAEDFHGLLVHVNQFTGLYVRNVHDFVDILKEPPHVAHSAALRIFVWYFSGNALLQVVSITQSQEKVYRGRLTRRPYLSSTISIYPTHSRSPSGSPSPSTKYSSCRALVHRGTESVGPLPPDGTSPQARPPRCPRSPPPSGRAQSSTGRFSTRQNSLVLFVTRVSPSALACAAISKSMGPMGIPFRPRSALIFPYSSAALAEKSNTAIGDRNREIASRFFSGAMLFSTPCISSP